ncbi:alkaline phosphatase family protein [uncultured Microbacterium sp.]|uniref:alkaline phosphatase family protein n=1 Tax=uncultured Microbacterium sp. TaxID=191216 RepID=UPI0026352D10|nr:alkaline phosphatase family protein [uncultured Microbacterium sp.]
MDRRSPAPTIFNRLEEAGIPWRVYYDPTQLVSLTGMLHASVLERYWKTHFRDMDQFYADVRNGTLPAYSFVEPRMVFNHNDMHPPWGELRDSTLTLDDGEKIEIDSSAYSDVRAGDKLIQDIYDAVRTSTSTTGSNAMNTALVITFDEHGGTYDHVAPPSTTPPTTGAPGESRHRDSPTRGHSRHRCGNQPTPRRWQSTPPRCTNDGR